MTDSIEKKKKGFIVSGAGLAGLSTGLTWSLYHDVKSERG